MRLKDFADLRRAAATFEGDRKEGEEELRAQGTVLRPRKEEGMRNFTDRVSRVAASKGLFWKIPGYEIIHRTCAMHHEMLVALVKLAEARAKGGAWPESSEEVLAALPMDIYSPQGEAVAYVVKEGCAALRSVCGAEKSESTDSYLGLMRS